MWDQVPWTSGRPFEATPHGGEGTLVGELSGAPWREIEPARKQNRVAALRLERRAFAFAPVPVVLEPGTSIAARDCSPGSTDSASIRPRPDSGLARRTKVLILGAARLDRGEVRGVRGQEFKASAACPEGHAGRCATVSLRTVHQDDVATPDQRRELRHDVGGEHVAVGRPRDHKRRDCPGHPQAHREGLLRPGLYGTSL